MLLNANVEMARATGVPITYLSTLGPQIKVLSMLHRTAKKHGTLVPEACVDDKDSQTIYDIKEINLYIKHNLLSLIYG